MRPVGWKVVVEKKIYFVIACSSPAAVRKALLEYITTENKGRDLRLSNADREWRIKICRTHKKEMENQQILK